jgi:hypothetical protein
MNDPTPWQDHQRSDAVEGERVSSHTCGCTPKYPCEVARRIFERGTRADVYLRQHLGATLTEQGERPGAGLGRWLKTLRARNRARALVGAR